MVENRWREKKQRKLQFKSPNNNNLEGIKVWISRKNNEWENMRDDLRREYGIPYAGETRILSNQRLT